MQLELTPQPLPPDYESLKDEYLLLQKKLDSFTQHVDHYNKSRDGYIRYLQKQLFSACADKTNFAIKLFDEAEFIFETAEKLGLSDDNALEDLSDVKGHKRKNKAKRQALPEHLPRVEVIHDIKEEEKICLQDGNSLHKIGDDVFEELEYQPAKLRVIRHITPKYGCRACEQTIVKAKLEERLIPKSYCSSSLLAHIIVSKYQHHLPLYRLEKMFAEKGITISRTSMSEWIIAFGKAALPLQNLMWEDLLASKAIQCDETPIQVLHIEETGTKKTAYMWVTVCWQSGRKIVLYEYDSSRSSRVPLRLFNEYSGYLQVDGYQGYNAITENPSIKRVGCLAHLRRYFVKALDEVPKKSRHEHPAARVITLIKKLYIIEDTIKEKDSLGKQSARQEVAAPIFQDLREFVEKEYLKVLPMTLYGKAISYAVKELPYISRYLECGDVAIDNNRVENCIRPFALGKKNWMFANTEKGANASATIYSLIETLKANGKNVENHLSMLVEKLPICKTVDDYVALLPY